jgi:long-chain fatty acid transport protein
MNSTIDQGRIVMQSSRPGLLFIELMCLVLLFTSASSQASGFQSSFHSVSSFSRGLGGAGVSGDDLADIYYNPASLSLYKPGSWQVYFGYGSIENEFNNKGSSRSVLGTSSPSDGDVQGIDEPTPGFSFVYIPETFLQGESHRFGMFFGNVYGNNNSYDSDWIGRYHAIDSKLLVLDFSPTLSFQISENTSAGIALSIQMSKAELSQAQIVPDGSGGFLSDGKSTVEGDDTAIGIGFGLVHKAGNATLGFSFRSGVEHKLEGDLKITGTPVDNKYSANAELDLPETVYLSAKFDFDSYEKWNLYWTSRWTNWSRNKELRVEIDGLSADSVIPQDWDDTWLHGVGVSYQYNDTWKFRFGLTVDETPIPNAELRTARLPEGDRKWVSLGFSKAVGSNGLLDVGFNHQILDDADINNTKQDLVPTGAITDTLSGTYEDGEVNIIGVQYSYDIK